MIDGAGILPLALSAVATLAATLAGLLSWVGRDQLRRIEDARSDQGRRLGALEERVRLIELAAAASGAERDHLAKDLESFKATVEKSLDELKLEVRGIARKVGSVPDLPAVRPRLPSRGGHE
jgi:hypothetical protein